MTGFKSTRRPLSILLSVLIILLSLAAAGAFSISASAATSRIYLDLNGKWDDTNRWICLKVYTTQDNFYTMTKGSDGIYYCDFDFSSSWAHFTFILKPNSDRNQNEDNAVYKTNSIQKQDTNTNNFTKLISTNNADSNWTMYNGGGTELEKINKDVLYLEPNDRWLAELTGNKVAYFYICFANSDSEHIIKKMTLVSDASQTIYKYQLEADVKNKYSYVTFCRVNPDEAANVDADKNYWSSGIWNRSDAQTNQDIIKNDENNNLFTLKNDNDNWGNGADSTKVTATSGNATGSWGKYTEPVTDYYVTLTDDETSTPYGNPKTKMEQNSTGYLHTFSSVKKGSATCSIFKGATDNNPTKKPITVDEWDSKVEIRLGTSGTWFEPIITQPEYRIYGSQSVFNSEEPGNSYPANKMTFQEEKYNSGTFNVEQGGSYWYNIAKDGEKYSSNIKVDIPYDNSKIVLSYTATSLILTDNQPQESITPPTYTCTDHGPLNPVDSSVEKGASEINHKRYQIVFEYNGESTFSIEGAKNGTVTISSEDTSKSGEITIFYDETKNNFQYEIIAKTTEAHYGDLNGDGSYNVIDAYIIRKIVDAGDDTDALKAIGLDEGINSLQYKLADVSDDNKVDSTDLDLMNDYIVGNIEAGASDNHITEEYDGSAP